MAPAAVSVRRARHDDRDRVLDLKCAVWPHLVRANELTRWVWEFDRNPAYDPERLTTLVIEDAGELVGLFTLIPHRVQVGETLGLACDGVDFCVADSHRGQGLSPLLVRRWMSEESCAFAFTTTPSDVAVHVFEGCGGLLLGGDGEPMAWSWFADGAHGPEPSASCDRVEPVDAVDAEADVLWQRVARHHRLALVKDAAYFDWRYLRFPFARPVLLAARDAAGALSGLAAVQHDAANERMMLCDLVAEPQQIGAVDGLIRAALQRTRDAGAGTLYVATRQPALLERLKAFSFQPVPGTYPRFLGKLNVAGDVAVTDWTTALGDGDQLYNVGEPEP